MKKLISFIACCLLFIGGTISQTADEIKQIKAASDLVKLKQLQTKYSLAAQLNKQQLDIMVAQYGWKRVVKLKNGSIGFLTGIKPDGTPKYTYASNVIAGQTTRTNFINSTEGLGLNLKGDNMNVFLWDLPNTRDTHVEFDGPGGQNRLTYNDEIFGNGLPWGHSTHVAGTMIAAGINPDAQGMAPHAKAYSYFLASKYVTIPQSLMEFGMLLSNHSYTDHSTGEEDWEYGAYSVASRDWDEILTAAPFHLAVVAASNNGSELNMADTPIATDLDDLGGMLVAKNNLLVSNVHDVLNIVDGVIQPGDIQVDNSSSRGPTDDLRVKPEIGGNGIQLLSAWQYSDTDYFSIDGTSMAAPNVTGSLLLLQEHANNVRGFFLKGATIKGLAIHTSDPQGILGETGPNPVIGWGLMNAKRAAEFITDNGANSLLEEMTLTEGEVKTIIVESDGINPIQASICWMDPAGIANTGILNDPTPVLVNDLDIRVKRLATNEEIFPWRYELANDQVTAHKGDNIVDNYERVDYVDHLNTAEAIGLYEITIEHKGTLSDQQQDFALLVTGARKQRDITVTAEVFDGSQYTNQLTLPVDCETGPFTIDFNLQTADCGYTLSGQSLSTVGFKIEWEGSTLALNAGDGVTGFDANGRLELPINDLINGIVVSADFIIQGPIVNVEETAITLSVDSELNPFVSICEVPEVTLTHALTCMGDLNGDGSITAADLTGFLTVFGTEVDDCSRADFDGNGSITAADLTGFLTVFGTTCTNDVTNTPQARSQSWQSELSAGEIDEINALLSPATELPILIFPNPTSGQLNIQYPKGIKMDQLKIRLFNYSGQLMFEKKAGGKSMNNLSLKGFPAGLYLIELSTDTFTQSSTIILQSE